MRRAIFATAYFRHPRINRVTLTGLILRSLRHHWRAYFAAGLASALGTAVLVGALLVGDSVHYSLRAMATERLGDTSVALQSGDRFFRADLAKRMSDATGFSFSSAESVLFAEGVCIADAKNTRANRVQVLGIGEGFWKLGENGPPIPPTPGEMILNERLAGALDAKPGDEIRIRFFKPGLLPRDAPLGSNEENAVVIRAKVKSIISDRGLGRFGLRAEQAAPFNAFLPISVMQEKLNQPGGANVLLLAKNPGQRFDPGRDDAADANALLQSAWKIEDGQLRIEKVPSGNFLQLTTPRVFLDDSVSGDLIAAGASGISTYFVNEIRGNRNKTPYSMVCAAGAPLVPAGLKDDEIVLNQWLADDLKAKAGDHVEIDFFSVGLMRKLETHTSAFTVNSIVPMEGQYADRSLMPEFPGISTVDSTHDWDSSIPIDMKKIRPKDEDYWKKYKGTPKAFVSLNRGVQLWQNRFGTYTALRYPFSGSESQARTDLTEAVRVRIAPAKLGLSFTPVRAMALAASDQAVDFGQLFLGFSFFLIASAVLLMALIFQFGVEARASEMGLLLALGFGTARVRLLFWAEGVSMAALGALFGVPVGILYAQVLLHALTTRWRAAVGTSFLEYHAQPQSLVIGGVSSVAVAAFAIFLAVRKQSARTAHELLSPPNLDVLALPPQAKLGAPASSRPVRGMRWLYAALICTALSVAIILTALFSTAMAAAEAFFSAGGLLLLAALAMVQFVLSRPRVESASTAPAVDGGALATLAKFGIRACSRRRGRSLATAALLATGTFLVVAVGANQQDAGADQSKTSGTGGFALHAQSTIPVLEDLNTPSGRLSAGLPENELAHAAVFPFRVKAGDEASCLNLNRAQKPRILGVGDAFIKRGGFTFVSTLADPTKNPNPWTMLQNHAASGAAFIPAICDNQSLTWALGLGVGEELSITDEHGSPVRIKFVGAISNSIMQGSILIGEADFLRLYPSESGYREFLIDAPAPESTAIAKAMQAALQEEGFQTTPAWKRLAEFNAVENTYLSTFQALGALGMLLGSLGLGIVVLRNMLERRSELALLSALGFSRRSIAWLVLSEHVWLLLLGLIAGVLPALVAVVPALSSTNVPVPWSSIGLSLLAILACGLGSALLATWITLRAPLLGALAAE